jgi:hypothetical protein
MADAKHNRRKFLQRSFFALTGAAVGGTIAAREEGEPEVVIPKDQPIAPVVAPEQELPFVRGLPDEVEALNKKHRQQHPRPDLERDEPIRGKPEQMTERSEREERIAKGAVVGGMVGLAVHMGATVNMKRSADAGATQNDPERVEWERRQKLIRDTEERYNQRRDDHDR